MSMRFRRFVFLTLAVSLLFGAATALAPLQDMRKRYDLSSEPEVGLSPGLALATQVLGWGRGLIIDVIWIRMETLKQEGRYFELVQLADWACKLAPRFPQVWDIQSWNLAYNVSAKVQVLTDRWAWVNAGIELLRDEGIPKNPYSAMLYDRLAWTFFHKIGEQTDSAHMFYKLQFGLMMHELFGGEGNRATLEALAAAPRAREALLQDPAVRALVAECGALGFDVIDGFFELYRETESVPDSVMAVVNRRDNLGAMYKVAFFARARRLRQEFKMDAEKMIEVSRRFRDEDGNELEVPFDWRTAYPHAIYWAHVGLEKLDELEARTLARGEDFEEYYKERASHDNELARDDEGIFEFRRIMLHRVIYGSMQSLVMHGRLLFDTKGRLMPEFAPDYRFADATLPLYYNVMEAHGQRFRMGTRDALKNFLRRGVTEFYLTQRPTKSRDYFRRLKEEFPEVVEGTPTYEQFLVAETERLGFGEMVVRDHYDMTNSEARRYVRSLLQRSLFALGCRQEDAAVMYEQRALAFVKNWNDNADAADMRDTLFYDRLREAVVVDVLTGTIRFPRDVLYNLRMRMEEEDDAAVRKILDNLKAEDRLLAVEEIEDKWKVSPY